MSAAHEDWQGKPLSVWPDEIKDSIFRKQVLDLLHCTRMEAEMLREQQEIEMTKLKKQLQRLSNPLKNKIGFHQNN